MKRPPFVLPELYIESLGAVLGIDLTSAQPKRSKDPKWRSIVDSVAQLNHGLTLDRKASRSGDYLKNDAARRAYQLYYMTTNFFKLWPALRELSHAGFFDRSDKLLTHLDLGSGSGTAIWSSALWLETECKDQHYDFIATDILRANLDDARNFEGHLFPKLAPKQPRGQYELLDARDVRAIKAFGARHGKFRLVTMMNALNEMEESNDAELIDALLDLLEEEGALILVEPSSREISRRALRFHDRALEQGAHIFSPCTHALRCPALRNEGDWCHTELPWQRPDFIKAIDDEIGTLRLSLKETYFTIRKSAGSIRKVAGARPGITARVVSERFDEKGRYRALLCSERGRQEFVMNKRDRSPNNEAFAKTERYDVVQVDSFEPREHDSKISQSSTYVVELTSSGARNVDK